MRHYLGIEIGGTKLQFAIGDEHARILERFKLSVRPGADAAAIRAQIEQALPGFLRGKNLHRTGAGFGGPVNWRTGRICRSHQIEGWSEFDLSVWLAKLTGTPVVVDNDANVAALGEATQGAGVGSDPVFYVTLGSGVGGGLVSGGAIYHGAMPGESEIGHIRLGLSGETLESRCSGWAVDARIRELARQKPGSSLAGLVQADPGNEARHLAAALAEGDLSAQALLIEISNHLAFGLSHAVHLMHPEVIVLGGGLALTGEPLRSQVEARLQTLVMEAFRPGLKVALASLQEDAVPAGALEIARRSELSS